MLSESCHLNDLMYVKVVEGKYFGIAQDDDNRIITLVRRSVTNFGIAQDDDNRIITLVRRSVTNFLISTNKARGNFSCINT